MIERLDEAVACYDKAIELKPEFADAYLTSGWFLRRCKSAMRHWRQFNKVLELKPNDAETISSIGLLYAEQGAAR